MNGDDVILMYGMVMFAPFEAGIQTYNRTQTSNIHTHQLIEGRPYQQFINEGADEIVLKVVLLPYFFNRDGDLPHLDYGRTQLYLYLESGTSHYLIYGYGRSLGIYLLAKITEDVTKFFPSGQGREEVVNMTLLFKRQRP